MAEEKIHDIENLIQKGEIAIAGRKIKSLKDRGKITRRWIAKAAQIARRSNQPHLALQILFPLFKREKGVDTKANEDELIEYAATLIYMGMVLQGRKHLSEIQEGKNPQRFFFMASSYIVNWEYAAAIPLLEKYIESEDLSDYQKIIGKLNLAMAYTYESNFKTAIPLVKEVIEYAEKNEKLYLENAALQLLGNIFSLSDQLDFAEEIFKKCREEKYHMGPIDELFLHKKELLLKHRQGHSKENTLIDFMALKTKASKLREWETVRDCDFHLARIGEDVELFTKLYYGTPIAGLRRNYLAEFGLDFQPPESFLYKTSKQRQKKILNLKEGTISPGKLRLPHGKAMHRLLCAITRDLYRPSNLYELFSVAFPEENFHPLHSSARVHSLMTRLRTWLEENEVPLIITNHHKVYQWKNARGLGLVFHLEEKRNLSKSSFHLQKLEQLFQKKKFFSLLQAANALDLSKSQSSRILAELTQAGHLHKEVVRRRIFFCLKGN